MLGETKDVGNLMKRDIDLVHNLFFVLLVGVDVSHVEVQSTDVRTIGSHVQGTGTSPSNPVRVIPRILGRNVDNEIGVDRIHLTDVMRKTGPDPLPHALRVSLDHEHSREVVSDGLEENPLDVLSGGLVDVLETEHEGGSKGLPHVVQIGVSQTKVFVGSFDLLLSQQALGVVRELPSRKVINLQSNLLIVSALMFWSTLINVSQLFKGIM